MKTGKSLMELAAELERQNEAKRDFVVDTSALQVVPHRTESGSSEFHGVDLQFGSNGGAERFSVRPMAHRQLGTLVGVPATYYDRMLEQAPELLAGNVNHWLRAEPKKRMVRTLDGGARAILSDRYRRIDNHDLAQVVLPALLEARNGAEIVSCEITERRMYIKAQFHKVRGEVRGQEVESGIVIGNSEVGSGKFSVSPYSVVLACTNGAVHTKYGVGQVHVGRRLETELDAAELFSDATKEADDRVLLMKARDVVNTLASAEKFQTILAKMRESAEAKIEGNPATVVELTAKRFSLTANEQGGVLRWLIEGGDASLWGLANAVTRLAQDATDYDRATELEALGGELIELPARDWKQLQAAA